ncbi:hypothetical protein AALO_G00246970 [Alosa alosa]|uniref:Reverse transcriptase domain-containing protein n=1 Tax=Alosa alosa TaxID=278164 RepID=A0AAV6FX55_9TELE|nr:hypothetical protein AALO_G00246970 [Alosa alosa]
MQVCAMSAGVVRSFAVGSFCPLTLLKKSASWPWRGYTQSFAECTSRSSTGVPHGSVLGPLLYSLDTCDRVATSNSIIVRFANNTVVAGLICDNDKKTLLEKED